MKHKQMKDCRGVEIRIGDVVLPIGPYWGSDSMKVEKLDFSYNIVHGIEIRTKARVKWNSGYLRVLYSESDLV